jgi:hypothetical protein
MGMTDLTPPPPQHRQRPPQSLDSEAATRAGRCPGFDVVIPCDPIPSYSDQFQDHVVTPHNFESGFPEPNQFQR